MKFQTSLKIIEIFAFFLVTIDLYGEDRLRILENNLSSWKTKKKKDDAFQGVGCVAGIIINLLVVLYFVMKLVHLGQSVNIHTIINAMRWYDWVILSGWIISWIFSFHIVVIISFFIYLFEKNVTSILEKMVGFILRRKMSGVMLITGAAFFLFVKAFEIYLIESI